MIKMILRGNPPFIDFSRAAEVVCLPMCGHLCFDSPDAAMCCLCWLGEHPKTKRGFVIACDVCKV